VWGIIIMFGTISAALTCYLRMKMPEMTRYAALITHNMEQCFLFYYVFLNLWCAQKGHWIGDVALMFMCNVFFMENFSTNKITELISYN
jgi:hypothetical protein